MDMSGVKEELQNIAVAATSAKKSKDPKVKKEKKPKKELNAAAEISSDQSKGKELGLAYKKSENFGDWYSDLVVKSELISYYDISGCYILRPWAYSMWKTIHNFVDGELGKLGVQDSYFPLFVPEKNLQKEKEHVEGFAAEVAWVTKSGDTELEMPIAIRPTSETVMYPYYSKWIRSHRDLPLKLNQWCNVVRWEFKHPTPFIRSREFLWQEGHSAFASREEADEEVYDILEIYRRVYEDLLAVPVIKGVKSELEKFAGGLFTTTVEAFVPGTGRGIQGATSHGLGQNFAKIFDISFLDQEKQSKLVWQNSWGLTTRTIGVMVMIHGDDKGLVLPPRVAAVQVVIIPVPYKDVGIEKLHAAVRETYTKLKEKGVRVEEDISDQYSPGYKYSQWEMKGVPLRIEIGPRDLLKQQVRIVRRDTFSKEDVAMEGVSEYVVEMLECIQREMLERAKKERDECIVKVKNWDEFMSGLSDGKMVLAPWCDEKDVEEDVKARTKGESGAAKTLCMPLEQPELEEGTKCFASGREAKKWALWGRSY